MRSSGTPREQIKGLTELAESQGMRPERIGFSNARLAYEDVIARFVWTLDFGTLGEKVTATRITERYRSSEPFSEDVLGVARRALSTFFAIECLDDDTVRLNKATAHSWLLFVARGLYKHQPRRARCVCESDRVEQESYATPRAGPVAQ